MANIFAILTAVALAAGAFFAAKNHTAYEEAIQDRKDAKKQLDSDQEEHAELVDKRDRTIEETGDLNTETASRKEEESTLQSGNDSIQQDIDSKRKTTESNATSIEKLENDLAELGQVEDLAADIQKLQEEIVSLEDEVSGAQVMQSNLTGEQASTDATIDRYKDENSKFSNKVSYGNARITAIYGPWGFVTLSAGAAGGIVPGSKLDVVRGGEVVAQLQVRSAEAGRASADVIPDSNAGETVLIVGDRVVPAAKN